jgi:integrase
VDRVIWLGGELAGPRQYRTPRVSQEIVLVVTHALETPLPPEAPGSPEPRLCVLRDRALLLTLYCTGMRRAEVASLNRDQFEDAWADRAIIMGKGDKDRVVFFDEETLAAIRAYLPGISEGAPGFRTAPIRAPRPRGVRSGPG